MSLEQMIAQAVTFFAAGFGAGFLVCLRLIADRHRERILRLVKDRDRYRALYRIAKDKD